MRKLFYLFFFVALSVSAQIELKIDSIISLDTIPTERKFTLNYHLENLTDKEVSFFLYPKTLTPNLRASQSKTIIYKIFQESDLLDIEDVFKNKKREAFFKKLEEAKTQKEKDSLLSIFFKKEMNLDFQTMIKKDGKELLKQEKELVVNSIISLKPKEKILYTKTLNWDKTRYYKIVDNEYYINEDKAHFIELSINLMKDGFNYNLEPEEFEKITGKMNFIQGTFTSNKMEINFKE